MNQKEREKKVTELYLSGKNCTFISRSVKIERKSVYRILERNNISLRPPEKKKCILCSNLILVEKEHNRSRCGTCNTAIRRFKLKQKAVDYKGGKCVDCGWTGDIGAFDFHHLDPEQKDFMITGKNIAGMKWEKIKTELDKCDLVCARCHRIKHSNYSNPLFKSEAEKND